MPRGSRLSSAQVVPGWSGPEGVKRSMHTKTGDSQCLAACGVLHCLKLYRSIAQDNGVDNRECQTLAGVC
jgi:hypothetical protein